MFEPILSISYNTTHVEVVWRQTGHLMLLYLVDAGRHLLYKQPFLLSLADKAGEEGETVVVGTWGAGRGLWGNIRRGRG